MSRLHGERPVARKVPSYKLAGENSGFALGDVFGRRAFSSGRPGMLQDNLFGGPGITCPGGPGQPAKWSVRRPRQRNGPEPNRGSAWHKKAPL